MIDLLSYDFTGFSLYHGDEQGQPPSLTALSLAPQDPSSTAHEQRITPFDVSGGVDETGKLLPVDYNKLIQQFGATPISSALLDRFEKVTGRKPHRFLRRGIVFSHRDLEKILDRHEKGQPFYLYTGRGPSSGSLHVGHSIPFEFTKYVQLRAALSLSICAYNPISKLSTDGSRRSSMSRWSSC